MEILQLWEHYYYIHPFIHQVAGTVLGYAEMTDEQVSLHSLPSWTLNSSC
jgi:hypothetical protein